ncbi:hypothetical protein [Mesorhizobium sp. M4B.F.Ca.ET.017.02.2.1]|uniref:hypothetical protein n=1 Tax=Mesorhizobium sp. M4B.F.Ca.ET.017.02.2.1 TaxID=2496649 RepID=UPI000FCB2B5F|nr:hypothetical protein [Mesorhizobium sp. M4B.F.Ca.ET.017.02.2.1]RVD21015.1 hypothetical protein EN738_20245 [Mesorhizobium sp. M4B.F.Ca.ET.017.02.2.1]
MTYSLSDLTKITGAKRRSVQFWAECGAILADKDTERAGTGTHRRFSRDEAMVSCVIAYFAQMHVELPQLTDLAAKFREMLPGIRHFVEQAISDEMVVYLIVQDRPQGVRMGTAGCRRDDPEEKHIDVDRTIGRFATEHLHEPDSGAIIMALNTHLAALR